MYEVKNTGLPPPRKNAPKYPWKQLAVGSSFLVPVSDDAYLTIRNTARARQPKVRQRYSCRVERDRLNKVIGIRVTRIA